MPKEIIQLNTTQREAVEHENGQLIILAGPGSGKTYIAKGLFGIPDKVNVSQTGMKMVNSDKELKYLLNKFGFGTNLDALPDEVFHNLTGDGKDTSGLRSFAKDLTAERRRLYQNGRLGMIIDGTGDDYQKIAGEKAELEKIGYQTYMIFVNTTLEVALQRNELRDRVLPQSIVSQSHKEVNRNIGAFQGLFGSGNFMIVDNNEQKTEDQAKKRFKMLVKQGLGKFVKSPIKSKKALSWIRKQKILQGKR